MEENNTQIQSSANADKSEGEQVSNISHPTSPSPPSLLEKAEAVAKRMEEANKKAEEILKKQEELEAKRVLGGRAEAGIPNKTPQQAEIEEAQRQASEIVKRFRR